MPTGTTARVADVHRRAGNRPPGRASSVSRGLPNEFGSRAVASTVRRVAAVVTWLVAVAAGTADDWPQWRGPNRESVWSESGILEEFPADGLKIRWRAPIGNGFSSPVVASGRAFVTDALLLTRPQAQERVHAFDAITGQRLWTFTYDLTYPDTSFDERYPGGPIATPVAADSRIYTMGAVGHIHCLDVTEGRVLWKKDLQKEYPGVHLNPCPSPLVEGDLLILLIGAKPDACLMAFHKLTGELVWKGLDEGPTASSPIVIESAGVRQLIAWTEQSVISLAPATGETLWRVRLNTTQDAAVSTPVYHDGHLLIGGLMMKLHENQTAADILWPRSRATARRVFSDTSTALFRGDYIYSARSFGEFICVDARTGQQIWETDKVTDRKSGASVHITAHRSTVLLYNDRGELIRARLSPDGYHEISRAKVLEPAVTYSGRRCAWAAPAFANRHIYARTSQELVCASLASEP